MRGFLAVALIALGTTLPASADTGAFGTRGSGRHISGPGAVEPTGLHLSNSRTVPLAAVWVVVLAGFGMAGMARRGRHLAAEYG